MKHIYINQVVHTFYFMHKQCIRWKCDWLNKQSNYHGKYTHWCEGCQVVIVCQCLYKQINYANSAITDIHICNKYKTAVRSHSDWVIENALFHVYWTTWFQFDTVEWYRPNQNLQLKREPSQHFYSKVKSTTVLLRPVKHVWSMYLVHILCA